MRFAITFFREYSYFPPEQLVHVCFWYSLFVFVYIKKNGGISTNFPYKFETLNFLCIFYSFSFVLTDYFFFLFFFLFWCSPTQSWLFFNVPLNPHSRKGDEVTVFIILNFSWQSRFQIKKSWVTFRGIVKGFLGCWRREGKALFPGC